jgi:hypothetical protein
VPEYVAASAEAEAENKEPAQPAQQEREEPAIAQPAQEPTLEDEMEELSELKAQMLRMEQSLQTSLGTTITQLKEENEALKRELRDVYKETGKTAPTVPTPDKALLEQVLKDPQKAAEDPAGVAEAVKEATEAAANPDAAKAALRRADPEVAKAVKHRGFLAIAEWGREPEDAAKSNPPRASLKGLIGVINPGASDEELQALGRRLRNDYDKYDNINVEIFDDRATAEGFKSGQQIDEKRHVLSVSRYKASQRDVIVLLTGGKPVEIPREEPKP